MEENQNSNSYFNKVVIVGAVVKHIMPRTTELITVSRSTCIKEIQIPAMSARGA